MSKHHDKDYKLQVAQLIVEDGKKAAQVARDMNIPISTVRKWVRAYRQKRENDSAGGTITPEQKPYKDIQNENEALKQELEILKKALHIFTKNP